MMFFNLRALLALLKRIDATGNYSQPVYSEVSFPWFGLKQSYMVYLI
jgi:hypothetical protein